MPSLRVNTNEVVSAANNIMTLNGQMRDSFALVQTAINSLNNNWGGSVSNMAVNKFNEIKNDFCSARYDVLNNFVNYMLQQVGQGYEDAEKTNISLADQFK